MNIFVQTASSSLPWRFQKAVILISIAVRSWNLTSLNCAIVVAYILIFYVKLTILCFKVKMHGHCMNVY